MEHMHNIRFRIAALILLGVALCAPGKAEALVKLEVEPAGRRIAVGERNTPVFIIAHTPNADAQFIWNLHGLGELKDKNAGNPGVVYLPPASIPGDTAEATITVSIRDSSGKIEKAEVNFTLFTPEPAPSPTPEDPSVPESLAIISDPAVESISLADEDRPTELILMTQPAQTDTKYHWSLSGPGTLEGDISSSVVLYIVPGQLSQRIEQTVITVTSEQKSGNTSSAELSFTIVAPPTDDNIIDDVPEEVLAFREQFGFAPVSAGTHAISKYLRQYLRFLERDDIAISEDFFIQTHEVTVGQFREYVSSLNEDQQEQIGSRWEKDRAGKAYTDERPVENVSWSDATAYAEWASAKTQWDLRLPTLEQWAAACVSYPGFSPVLTTPDSQPLPTVRQEVDHLLGNLREWSATACEDGEQLLLGENYMSDVSDPASFGQKQCSAPSERWRGIGFRLMRKNQ